MPYIAVPPVRCTDGAIQYVPTVRCTVAAIHCCAICTLHCWCHTLLLCTMHFCCHTLFLCTIHCWCHTLLYHLYSALMVPYHNVPTVRFTVDVIHCCANCTVHCWCHTIMCQLYGALLVPYIAVPSIQCTVGVIYCCAICTMHCWCHTLLLHKQSSAENNLVSQSAPFCCLPFCSTQFLTPSTHPNTKPDTLPHNVLLSTKFPAISVRWVIQRRL